MKNQKIYLKTILIFFLLINSYIFSQNTIQGTVKNEENKNVSYSAIGVKDSNIGTISNENGFYNIEIPSEFQSKEILFKAEGYEEKSIKFNELKANPNVYLKYKISDIKEVVIKEKKMKEKVIGEKSRPMLTFSKMFDKNIPTIEQGNIFEIYNFTKLKNFSFHIIPSSRYEEITLKLNIYDVKNGLPHQSILSENIIYKTSLTGWQSIDLTRYKLLFKNLENIAITLQLVNHKALIDEEFIFGVSARKSLSKNLIFRHQSQSQWEKSSGNFLTNISVAYDKDIPKKNIAEDSLKKDNSEYSNTHTPFNTLEKFEAFAKGRSEGEKTIYGRNPTGKYINLADAKIYYEEYGAGEPLILLQGNDGRISDYYLQIPFFAQNYRVIAIDTRAQGKSLDFAKEDYNYETFANDLLQIVKELNLSKVNIIGWSDGGITGLIFNHKNPNLVNKLITIGANTHPSGIYEDAYQDIKNVYDNAKDAKTKRRLNLMVNHPNITENELGKISNPVLVIAGSDDEIKEAHTKELARNIKKSEIEIISNSTHYVPFEQPEILNKTILDFLKK